MAGTGRISVAMFSPHRRQCGISDYTDYLLAELTRISDVRQRLDVADLGVAPIESDIAHVQHQYFLFGGVAPWKNSLRQRLNRVSKPLVLTAHEFVDPSGPPWVRAAIRVTNSFSFRHRSILRIIVHTDWDRSRMRAESIDESRISVITHGVPPSPTLPSRAESRQDLGYADDDFVVTVFGFISRRKGHLAAIQALKMTPNRVKLLLAGGRHPDDRTDYVDDVENTIASLGLADRVRLTGYLPMDRVGSIMAATDLVVAPFTESSGSGSLALAFACGKPILASPIPPHQEISRDTPAALALMDSLAVSSVAQGITRVSEDETQMAALSAGAGQYAAAHSYQRAAEETVRLYGDVLGGSA